MAEAQPESVLEVGCGEGELAARMTTELNARMVAIEQSDRDELVTKGPTPEVYSFIVEHTAWTDERLDDLANRMDAGFARVDADIRELRAELRAEIGSLRLAILRVGGGIMIGLVGVMAAIFVSPING